MKLVLLHIRSNMHKVMSIYLVMLLTACSSNEQIAAEKLKLSVAEKMKDPESVQFRNLKLDSGILCGEANSKNSFGAYAGFDRFSASETFVHMRQDFLERDRLLQDTPANPEWKNGAANFDKFWDQCQRDGKPVD